MLRCPHRGNMVRVATQVSDNVRKLLGLFFHKATFMGSCVSQYSGQVPAEGKVTEARSAPSTLSGKQEEPYNTPVLLVSPLKGKSSLRGFDDTASKLLSSKSTSSPTYTNLGLFRANITPLKQPRNPKTSDNTLRPGDTMGTNADSKAAPPLLPKKTTSMAHVDTSSKEAGLSVVQPKVEVNPSGTNLTMVNPVYDLDSTWETASQSSFISSESQPPGHEFQDALEVPNMWRGRAANSFSCLLSTTGTSATANCRGTHSTESLVTSSRLAAKDSASKPQRQLLYRGMDNWDEMGNRIRGLHRDMLHKLAGKCQERFSGGQTDELIFGIDDWSDFRLITGKPCCEAEDAVYYSASYAKYPQVPYAIKVCRGKVKETQWQFLHDVTVRQSVGRHFNIQQDCGNFIANLPAALLFWENKEKEKATGKKGTELSQISAQSQEESQPRSYEQTKGLLDQSSERRAPGSQCSRVVVITREVPFQTLADFVREGTTRHARNPDLYERQVCLLLLQLCQSLEHLKLQHITHSNLRLENLLLVACQPGNPCTQDATNPSVLAANSACPARLLISNFSQAKLKSQLIEVEAAKDHSRIAPEIVATTQYKKCDEFQTGILIYEMLHLPNPFEELPELREKEYTCADLPPLPTRSLYSPGLEMLARLLLCANPSDRLEVAEARACLQCLLWGPRDDLFQALSASPSPTGRETILQNWLDLKQTLMMIKFAERSLDTSGVSLEDWLCCQYVAFSTTDSLSHTVRLFLNPQQKTYL
ncbi:pseudopodium-enriched atypical kinase 1-like [Arapaima gigas]